MKETGNNDGQCLFESMFNQEKLFKSHFGKKEKEIPGEFVFLEGKVRVCRKCVTLYTFFL